MDRILSILSTYPVYPSMKVDVKGSVRYLMVFLRAWG